MSEEDKEKLKEYQKNYRGAKVNMTNFKLFFITCHKKWKKKS